VLKVEFSKWQYHQLRGESRILALVLKFSHSLACDEMKLLAIFSCLCVICSALRYTFEVTMKEIRCGHLHMC
jgi:hypothetical protein